MRRFPEPLRRTPRGKPILTPEQVKWLRVEYPKTKNGELCSAMGLCYDTLRKLAKTYGLEKNKKWMEKIHKEAQVAAVQRLHELGWYEHLSNPENMQHTLAGQRRWLSEGHRPMEGWSRQRLTSFRKRQSSHMKQLLARERIRTQLGLPQLTRRTIVNNPYTKQQVDMRHRMYAKGYTVIDAVEGPERFCIYYDNQTSRSAKMEKFAAQIGFKIAKE